MIRKLRMKFVIVNMAIVVVMLGFIFALVFHFTSANLESESIQMMQTIAGRPFRPEIPGRPDLQEQEILLPYFMVHMGPDGEMLTLNGGFYDLTDEELMGNMVKAAASSSKVFDVIPEYNLRFYKQSFPGRQCIVFADISSERSTLDSMIKTCGIIGFFSLVVFLGISILLSKWAVRPIEEAWNGQRKFLDDASHELKTPLAVILTNSELACSDDYSAEEKRRFVENIHTMSSHMKVLVEQMLELSRTDRPVSKPVEQIVDFSGIVNHIALTLEAMLFEKGHPLACEISPDILVKGNEQQLSQVVEILLDNAGKYASENGGIQVFLNRQGNRHCVLTVRNEGQEIPEEELKNLFKRFYRMDSSRTRDGSFGLGLSIAENIVNSHRGKIRAESKDGWNSFYVSIPAADK